MRRHIAILTLAWLVLMPAAPASSKCREAFASLLRQTAHEIGSWFRDTTKFELSVFERAKTFFTQKLALGEKITPEEIRALGDSRPALALALWEAASDRAGTQAAGVRSSLKASPELQRREEKALAKLDPRKPLGFADIEEFVERVYLASNEPSANYPNLPGWLASRLPIPSKELLRQRLQEAIWRNDLLTALDSLGITRDPSLRMKVRDWLAAHPNLWEGVFTAGFDAFTLKLFGAPGYLPKFQILRGVTIPPELLERARREGFDAVYPELKRLYGNYAKFDSAYMVARSTLYRGAVALIAYGLISALGDHPFLVDPRFWLFLKRFKTIDDNQLDDLQKRTFDAEAIRREQFLSFKKAYEDAEGPFDEELPNPWDVDYVARCQRFPASYREEADSTWRILQAMTPEQLQATFGKQAKPR